MGSPSPRHRQDIVDILYDLVERHVPSSSSRPEHICPTGDTVGSAAQHCLNTASESVPIDSGPIATPNGESNPRMFDGLI